jgi:hypothetical protein
VVVGADHAAQHLEHRELTDERVGDRLEHVEQRLRALVGRDLDQVVTGDHRDRTVERARARARR